jgi:HAMP domain-containing protein
MSEWTKERIAAARAALDESNYDSVAFKSPGAAQRDTAVRAESRAALDEIERMQAEVSALMQSKQVVINTPPTTYPEIELAMRYQQDEIGRLSVERHEIFDRLMREHMARERSAKAEIGRLNAELAEAVTLVRTYVERPNDTCTCHHCTAIRDFLERNHEPQIGEPSKEG